MWAALHRIPTNNPAMSKPFQNANKGWEEQEQEYNERKREIARFVDSIWDVYQKLVARGKEKGVAI